MTTASRQRRVFSRRASTNPSRRSIIALAALALGLAVAAPAVADSTVIRLGYPGVGIDNRPFGYGDNVSVAHIGHFIEDEFKNDPDVKVEWTFFRGAGPAVNEAIANGQLDFGAGEGDLPSIVARSKGLKTKIILAADTRDPIYLAVKPDSGIAGIDDLKGRKVAQFRGTNLQIATDRVLEAHGLTERDIKLINLDTGNTLAALASGDIDGAFGGPEYLDLDRRGIVKVVYSTKSDDPAFGRQAALLVTEDFESRHPDLTARVVRAVVRSAQWSTDESNREAVFQGWTKSGIPVETFRADFAGVKLTDRLSPIIDDFFVARYRAQAERAKAYKLLRDDVDVDSWFEPKYLNQALADLKLEDYWPRYDATGKKVATGTVEQTQAATQ
jgi:sulfonate transport system substrate-binding protein